ncbi:hypothetical protein B0T22DRAFT_514184 [Podospora appendiculata]|uniref:Uncharacterized protein n=1 Tax=Podospora appendiculata TaxID=314037 RepID=A0AAE0XBH3_9PEZI|nr:hypothetical protein B0T22DRAFT_514184 [Podospora appendiculata]
MSSDSTVQYFERELNSASEAVMRRAFDWVIPFSRETHMYQMDMQLYLWHFPNQVVPYYQFSSRSSSTTDGPRSQEYQVFYDTTLANSAEGTETRVNDIEDGIWRKSQKSKKITLPAVPAIVLDDLMERLWHEIFPQIAPNPEHIDVSVSGILMGEGNNENDKDDVITEGEEDDNQVIGHIIQGWFTRQVYYKERAQLLHILLEEYCQLVAEDPEGCPPISYYLEDCLEDLHKNGIRRGAQAYAHLLRKRPADVSNTHNKRERGAEFTESSGPRKKLCFR